MIPRRRWHRTLFSIAGVYNILWGLYAAVDPQWLFRFAGMPPLNHPQIFACLGMVVGLYGLLYLEVARVPEKGWLLAAVGLLGKITASAILRHDPSAALAPDRLLRRRRLQHPLGPLRGG
jgi:hypothetical protein